MFSRLFTRRSSSPPAVLSGDIVNLSMGFGSLGTREWPLPQYNDLPPRRLVEQGIRTVSVRAAKVARAEYRCLGCKKLMRKVDLTSNCSVCRGVFCPSCQRMGHLECNACRNIIYSAIPTAIHTEEDRSLIPVGKESVPLITENEHELFAAVKRMKNLIDKDHRVTLSALLEGSDADIRRMTLPQLEELISKEETIPNWVRHHITRVVDGILRNQDQILMWRSAMTTLALSVVFMYLKNVTDHPWERVKIRTFSGETGTSEVFFGTVIQRNLLNKAMPRDIKEPKIFLYRGAIEFDSGMMTEVQRDEYEVVTRFVTLLHKWGVNIVLCGSNVASGAATMFVERGIAVACNVNVGALEKLSFISGASITNNMDNIEEESVGYCYRFRVRTFDKKPLLCFEGQLIGLENVSVLLRGYDGAEMMSLWKRVLKWVLYVAHCLRFECEFLRSSNASVDMSEFEGIPALPEAAGSRRSKFVVSCSPFVTESAENVETVLDLSATQPIQVVNDTLSIFRQCQQLALLFWKKKLEESTFSDHTVVMMKFYDSHGDMSLIDFLVSKFFSDEYPSFRRFAHGKRAVSCDVRELKDDEHIPNQLNDSIDSDLCFWARNGKTGRLLTSPVWLSENACHFSVARFLDLILHEVGSIRYGGVSVSDCEICFWHTVGVQVVCMMVDDIPLFDIVAPPPRISWDAAVSQECAMKMSDVLRDMVSNMMDDVLLVLQRLSTRESFATEENTLRSYMRLLFIQGKEYKRHLTMVLSCDKPVYALNELARLLLHHIFTWNATFDHLIGRVSRGEGPNIPDELAPSPHSHSPQSRYFSDDSSTDLRNDVGVSDNGIGNVDRRLIRSVSTDSVFDYYEYFRKREDEFPVRERAGSVLLRNVRQYDSHRSLATDNDISNGKVDFKEVMRDVRSGHDDKGKKSGMRTRKRSDSELVEKDEDHVSVLPVEETVKKAWDQLSSTGGDVRSMCTWPVRVPFPEDLCGECLLFLPAARDGRIINLFGDEPSSAVAYVLASEEYLGRLRSDVGDEAVTTLLKGPKSEDGIQLANRVLCSAPQSPFHYKQSMSEVGGGVKKEIEVLTYFPQQFSALRALVFSSSPEDLYLESMARSLKFNTSGGKSGSTFSITWDKRFVMKEIHRVEFDFFLNFAPTYFKYISKNVLDGLPTLLARIVGVYRVGYRESSANSRKGWARTYYIVSENVFYGANISKEFDLKGSRRNRYQKDENSVQWDENLLESVKRGEPLLVTEEGKSRLSLSIWNDSLFLSGLNVMDYSLLVGVNKDSGKYHVGLVDYIRRYTWDKHLETWFKQSGMGGGQKGLKPTVISPRDYKTRFRDAMNSYFVMVPDMWTRWSSGIGRNKGEDS